MEITDDQKVQIYDEFREEFNLAAPDSQLRDWGNTEDRIKEIKLEGVDWLLHNISKGHKVQQFVDRIQDPVTQIYRTTTTEFVKIVEIDKIDTIDFAKYCISMSKQYASILLTPEKLIEFYLLDKKNENEVVGSK